MAGRGPTKDPRAIRRNKEPDKQLIKSDGVLRGFPLPEGMLTDKFGDPEDWHPATIRWWNSWRQSPQAAAMLSEPDWYALLDTALIHHNMWKNGRWEFASEVRLRVAKFGATPEDRIRLKQEIEVPETSPVGNSASKAQNVTSLSARRDRLAAGE